MGSVCSSGNTCVLSISERLCADHMSLGLGSILLISVGFLIRLNASSASSTFPAKNRSEAGIFTSEKSPGFSKYFGMGMPQVPAKQALPSTKKAMQIIYFLDPKARPLDQNKLIEILRLKYRKLAPCKLD